MYCTHCGKELAEEAYLCPNCGNLVPDRKRHDAAPKREYPLTWGVLSFFLPLLGLILIFVFIKKKTKASLMCLRGTIVGILAYIGICGCFWLALTLVRNVFASMGY